MFGAHLSIAGGLVNALSEAERLRMDCVQVFTRNQRQWATRPLDEGDRDRWLAELRRMGWRRRRPPRTVCHSSYLINLASPDPTLHRKSIALYRVELERCEALAIPLCVVHPGAHMREPAPRDRPLGGAPTKAEAAGLRRIVRALDHIHRDLPGCPVLTCLETTAGAGSTLGYDFRHLAEIRAAVGAPERVAFCFDTCHVLAAGYDLTAAPATRGVLAEFDGVCGLRNLRVLHLNDSRGARGSRVDRHAHIGHGACGTGPFGVIVNSTRLRDVPKVLETPKGADDRGVEWDVANIRRLKRLRRRRGET